VLIIGSGQSGCQIAEELSEAGRDVFVACGRAPWVPRRIGDRDAVWWAHESGYFDAPLSSLPSPAARFGANVQSSGTNGGHDLHFRTLQAMGVTLLGPFAGADGDTAQFATDLNATVGWSDERHGQLMELIRKVAAWRGLPVPETPAPEPFSAEAPEHLSLDGFGAVVFATGFRPDYATRVHISGAFDELGFPTHHEGPARSSPVCTSSACISCASASRRCSWEPAKTAPIVVRQIAERSTPAVA
jgi:putative flavoprotein involved in K+ transport